jgi:hypothetical protein
MPPRLELPRRFWRDRADDFFEAKIAAQWIRRSTQMQLAVVGSAEAIGIAKFGAIVSNRVRRIRLGLK